MSEISNLSGTFGNIGRLRLQTLSFTRIVPIPSDGKYGEDVLECECELDDAPMGDRVDVFGAPVVEIGSWPDALNSSRESPWKLQPDGRIRRVQSLQLQPT